MNIRILCVCEFLFILFNILYSAAQQTEVKVSGAMKNVMWKGELSGTINLDTISDKLHLYGLGPAEFLRGELLIIDGKSYKSTVLSKSTMLVEETYKARAPFFVYSNTSEWKEMILPDSVTNYKQLESFIDQTTKTSKRQFAFKLSGIIDTAVIHIVNLPEGAEVHSPEDAHNGEINFILNNEPVDVVGFFSTEHKGIFTHHDTNIHMHLITADRKKMGHLEEMIIKKGAVKLFLPNE